MTCTLHVAWDGRLAGYDFGPGHPMAPLRLRLTMELAQALGLGRQDGVTVAVPAAATDAELELVHDPAYIAMVRLAGHQAAGGGPSGDLTTRALLVHGLGTDDHPLFAGMHEASAMVTGATLAAARAVWTSDIRNAGATARLLRPVRRLFHSALAEAHKARDQRPLPEGTKAASVA
jgi:acetoin utilization protein AcuC